MKNVLVIALVVAALAACQKKENTTPMMPAGGGMTGTNGQLPPGHPAVGENPMGGAPHGMGSGKADPTTAGIAYDLPKEWKRTNPASSMRIDQAIIPGAGGNGDLAVFFFGEGQGGSVDANLERWAAQMTATQPAKRETFEVNGFKVTMMDLSGTLHPSSMGMGPQTDQPNSRMFAAVVEHEGGPWFFKATGPAATMAAEHDHFVQMIKSVHLPTPVA